MEHPVAPLLVRLAEETEQSSPCLRDCLTEPPTLEDFLPQMVPALDVTVLPVLSTRVTKVDRETTDDRRIDR